LNQEERQKVVPANAGTATFGAVQVLRGVAYGQSLSARTNEGVNRWI
jgi:hypothetical protein